MLGCWIRDCERTLAHTSAVLIQGANGLLLVLFTGYSSTFTWFIHQTF